jgi:hypothetical protein
MRHHVERNRARLDYPAFRAAGQCTSNDVVEPCCKVAVGTRCKRAGMHWTVAGDAAIITLHFSKVSGRFACGRGGHRPRRRSHDLISQS